MTETRLTGEDAPNASVGQNVISGSGAGHLALVPTWLPLDVAPAANVEFRWKRRRRNCDRPDQQQSLGHLRVIQRSIGRSSFDSECLPGQ